MIGEMFLYLVVYWLLCCCDVVLCIDGVLCGVDMDVVLVW